MAPIWIMTCGQMIFGSTTFTGSYLYVLLQIAIFIVPLCVGATMQKCLPCSANFFMQTLKWLLHICINSVIIYLIVINVDLFSPAYFKFTWKVKFHLKKSESKGEALKFFLFFRKKFSYFWAACCCHCLDISSAGLWHWHSNGNLTNHQRLQLRPFPRIFRLSIRLCKFLPFFRTLNCMYSCSVWCV